MKVGLFIPCYIDALYPEVGFATLELLEKSGVEVGCPLGQTCCGKPVANEGDFESSRDSENLFLKNFGSYEYIVAPAGSCVADLHYRFSRLQQTKEVKHIRENTYELVQFLHDVVKVKSFPGVSFHHKVALHIGCSSLRKLNLAKPSEAVGKPYNKPANLLRMVEGVELVEFERQDECCGFGGSFSVTDEVMSRQMGCDKVASYLASGAECIVSTDMSCLMHQQDVTDREKITHLSFFHIAQVLNGGPFK